MARDLTLLDGVAWDGAPVVGERSRALLAALAIAGGRPVRAERLIDAIWGEDPPANAAKALQVVVSRTRAACDRDAIVHQTDGYRLGVEPDRVDAARLSALVARAGETVGRDPSAARSLAGEALGIADGLRPPPEDEEGPLAEVLRHAAADTAAARVLRARAAARLGEHDDALDTLDAAAREDPDDESLLADLLRSVAAVRGPGPALERYEAHRRGLRERLGTEPGEELRRVQRDLLAQDRPVREGVRYDATELLGRAGDVGRVRALLQDSRVVSILGPGGLGKTRLAHVLARDASQPVVHVVELVGVTSPDDVVGEVGSVLGVRDSVAGRRALSPEQRADVRGRIAQRLGQAPSLLVLDNCEHLVDAVAGLVAFLVSATADLRVLTTTRAPLSIAAERVYPLDALAPGDAVELFRRRAVAARPDVRLDPVVVDRVVRRLDGLPLAIELAAARTRAMAVDEIDRRLEDRFALLRGGDRGAPDRHRTLQAVIDWSWNLLDEPERRALRRLSVFHDGFTLEAAEAVLGPDALRHVERLADQSLLSVAESPAGVRHRMLETVREFGRLRLVDAGEEAEADAAHRAWATAYAARHGRALFGPAQFDAVDALVAEDGNLADALRRALDDPDPGAVVQLLAGIGSCWSLRGEHGRVIVLLDAVGAAVEGWTPPAELVDAARVALVVTLTNAMVTVDERTGPLRALLDRIAGEPIRDAQVAASVRVLSAYDPARSEAFTARLEVLAEDPDRHVARQALQWAGHAHENAGDPERALRAASRALDLARPEDGPWLAAILQAQVAQLCSALGDPRAAIEHAAAALPVLERLGARDDLVQCRALIALAAMSEGRLDDAAAELERIERVGDLDAVFGGRAAVLMARAEMALATGRTEEGIAAHRDLTVRMRHLAFPSIDPSGWEPWILLSESALLTALACRGGADDADEATAQARRCRDVLRDAFASGDRWLDHPAVGLVLFALGAWGTARAALEPDDAAALLVLAERFAYTRGLPSMAWEPVAAAAEARAPGRLDAFRATFVGRGPDARDDAARVVAGLPI